MSRFSTYCQVDQELGDDPAVRTAVEKMMYDSVTGQGLTPTGPMRYTWSEEFPHRVDPYDYLPRWQKLLIRLRFLPRPQPFTVQQWGVRGVIEVAEDPP